MSAYTLILYNENYALDRFVPNWEELTRPQITRMLRRRICQYFVDHEPYWLALCYRDWSSGLVGFVTPSMSYSQGIQTISEMSSSLHHRDQINRYWYYDQYQFVLIYKIIHPRYNTFGCQPMKLTVGVIHNGEIYNHKELKNDILAKNSNHFLLAIVILKFSLHIHFWTQSGIVLDVCICSVWSKFKFVPCRDRFGEKPLLWFVANPWCLPRASISNILTLKRNYLIKEVLFILNTDIFQHHILSMIIFIRLAWYHQVFLAHPRLFLINLSILTVSR